MTIFPVTVPASLVSATGLEPEAGDWHRAVRHAVGTPDGETYVLSGLWRQTRYGGVDDGRDFICQLITRHGPDGDTRTTAVITHEAPGGAGPTSTVRRSESLTLLPDGTLVLSGKPGNTHLFTPELDRLLAAWHMDDRPSWSDEPQTDDPFAATVSVTPGGRLLCLTSEHRLENWGYPRGNLIAVSEPGDHLAPGHSPSCGRLRVAASCGVRKVPSEMSRIRQPAASAIWNTAVRAS
ncbi:hypothetical protein GCM10020229_16990 [Kitasatospora albolonga]|uniref:hypothetical protein n=1 Tax=Kitasatospora albolonga TaxID=68173 RepID=UPI0031E5F907